MSTATPQEDDYHSSSDSDFNEELSASSAEEVSSEDELANRRPKGKSRKRKSNFNDDGVEMGSGDEGIIAQGQKKRRKKEKGKKGQAPKDEAEEESEDEAGGIRVRLRNGRGGEEKAKKAISKTTTATADIDSIWARMNAPPSTQNLSPQRSPSPDQENRDPDSTSSPTPAPAPPSQEETIAIPHTYNFAGQSHITQKIVPLASLEAQAYLKSLEKPKHSRPLARKNLLEPNPSRLIRGVPSTVRTDLPPSIGGSMPKGRGVDKKTKDPKLNTVEKSKMDWEAEVERAGIREELDKAGKSSKDYLGRKEFLDRVEMGRDERERAERLKGRG